MIGRESFVECFCAPGNIDCICPSEFPYRRPRRRRFLMTNVEACETFVSHLCEPDDLFVNVRVVMGVKQLHSQRMSPHDKQLHTDWIVLL